MTNTLMPHDDSLVIIQDNPSQVKVWNDCNNQQFNVIIVLKISDTNKKNLCNLSETTKINYNDKGIEVSNVLFTTETIPIKIFKQISELLNFLQVFECVTNVHKSHISFWFDGVIGYVSEVNNIFELGHKNKWKYYHPGTKFIADPEILFLNFDTYSEYEKKNKECSYTYAPFIPLVAPVYDHTIWKLINKLLENYNYESENAFTKHWIPEMLSNITELVHPIIIKTILIEYEHTRKSRKDEDYNKAKTECYTKINELFFPELNSEVYCISLNDAESQKRKEQFALNAKTHDLDFEFWSAVDGRNWTRSDYPACIAHKGRRVDWHEPLKPGEVGIALSHKQLIQEAWNKHLYALIVFEDDAIITKNFNCIDIPADADFLALSNRYIHNKHGECLIGSCGTEGYIITRRGMYKMLQILEHIDMPIDLLMVAHANSVIKSQVSLSSVRNPLNPILNIYHNEVYCINGDHGISTFKR